MRSTQINKARAKPFCAGGVAGVFGVEFLFEGIDVLGVASIFFFDALAECNDLVCWGLVLQVVCRGFMGRSGGRCVDWMMAGPLVV